MTKPSAPRLTEAPGAVQKAKTPTIRSGWFRKARLPYLMVLPAVLITLVLVVYPLVLSVVNSFRVDNILEPTSHQFVGLANYTHVLSDPAFQQAARNSLVYFLFGSAVIFVASLAIAMWLHNITHRWRALFLVFVMLPWAVPGVVTGLMWLFIYNPTTSGLLNVVLLDLHLIHHSILWLTHPGWNLILISVALVWQTLPLTSVIMLAGIESIPPELYEAAKVDGSRPWHAFSHITLPLIRPALAIAMVQAGVLTIGVFDQVYVLTGYDPSTKSSIIQTYLYAFQNLNLGQGISAAMIVTIGVTIVGVLYLRGIYREVSF